MGDGNNFLHLDRISLNKSKIGKFKHVINNEKFVTYSNLDDDDDDEKEYDAISSIEILDTSYFLVLSVLLYIDSVHDFGEDFGIRNRMSKQNALYVLEKERELIYDFLFERTSMCNNTGLSDVIDDNKRKSDKSGKERIKMFINHLKNLMSRIHNYAHVKKNVPEEVKSLSVSKVSAKHKRKNNDKKKERVEMSSDDFDKRHNECKFVKMYKVTDSKDKNGNYIQSTESLIKNMQNNRVIGINKYKNDSSDYDYYYKYQQFGISRLLSGDNKYDECLELLRYLNYRKVNLDDLFMILDDSEYYLRFCSKGSEILTFITNFLNWILSSNLYKGESLLVDKKKLSIFVDADKSRANLSPLFNSMCDSIFETYSGPIDLKVVGSLSGVFDTASTSSTEVFINKLENIRAIKLKYFANQICKFYVLLKVLEKIVNFAKERRIMKLVLKFLNEGGIIELGYMSDRIDIKKDIIDENIDFLEEFVTVTSIDGNVKVVNEIYSKKIIKDVYDEFLHRQNEKGVGDIITNEYSIYFFIEFMSDCYDSLKRHDIAYFRLKEKKVRKKMMIKDQQGTEINSKLYEIKYRDKVIIKFSLHYENFTEKGVDIGDIKDMFKKNSGADRAKRKRVYDHYKKMVYKALGIDEQDNLKVEDDKFDEAIKRLHSNKYNKMKKDQRDALSIEEIDKLKKRGEYAAYLRNDTHKLFFPRKTRMGKIDIFDTSQRIEFDSYILNKIKTKKLNNKLLSDDDDDNDIDAVNAAIKKEKDRMKKENTQNINEVNRFISILKTILHDESSTGIEKDEYIYKGSSVNDSTDNVLKIVKAKVYKWFNFFDPTDEEKSENKTSEMIVDEVYRDLYDEDNKILSVSRITKKMKGKNPRIAIRYIPYKTIGDFSQIIDCFHYQSVSSGGISPSIFITFDRVCSYISTLFNYTFLESKQYDEIFAIHTMLNKNTEEKLREYGEKTNSITNRLIDKDTSMETKEFSDDSVYKKREKKRELMRNFRNFIRDSRNQQVKNIDTNKDEESDNGGRMKRGRASSDGSNLFTDGNKVARSSNKGDVHDNDNEEIIDGGVPSLQLYSNNNSSDFNSDVHSHESLGRDLDNSNTIFSIAGTRLSGQFDPDTNNLMNTFRITPRKVNNFYDNNDFIFPLDEEYIREHYINKIKEQDEIQHLCTQSELKTNFGINSLSEIFKYQLSIN